jgi:nucleotide-binding universal stress UspA family protein
MTIVVGISPEERGRAAVHLAAILARSAGDDDLILGAVVPRPWPPSPARVDAEYRAHFERAAEEALQQASAQLPADIASTALVHHARSAPAGLLEVADQNDASVIVVGSSSAGVVGRVALGSVSSRLMHSSHIPVALPPRGYRCKPVARVARVTAAYGGPDGGDDLVLAAAGVAASVGATLRIASFAVRAHPPYTSGVGTEPERSIIDQWAQEIEAAGRATLDKVGRLPAVPPAVEAAIGYGESWEEALDDVEWHDGDVLVVGSSSMGPIARVFLGSRASKIVRNSPVPAVVVSRGTAADLADQAVGAETARA